MIRSTLITAVALAWAPATAVAQPESLIDDHLARARDAFERKDLPRARDELLAAYQLEPRPDLLFALGQVELNLERYAAAIDYYERFLATAPAPDQATVAQQAIGAARIRMSDAATVKPAPIPRRDVESFHDREVYGHRFDPEDGVLAGLGVGGLLVGALLYRHGHSLDDDASGTLLDYADRQTRSRRFQISGAVVAGAGVGLALAAVLHWRLEVDLLRVESTPDRATGLAIGGRW